MAGNISFFADGLIPWTGDDIEDTSLYGKPAHATHVYLPYIEGQKLLMSKCSPSNCPLLVFTWTLWILISSFYNFFILMFSFFFYVDLLAWFVFIICILLMLILCWQHGVIKIPLHPAWITSIFVFCIPPTFVLCFYFILSVSSSFLSFCTLC